MHQNIFATLHGYPKKKKIFCEKISLSCIEIFFSHSYEMREEKKAQKRSK